MDCELAEEQASGVRLHLAVCEECAAVCEDLASIIDVCTLSADEIVPPNPQALWCRINNIIETEAKAAAQPPAAEPAPRRRLWQLSFAQLTAAVVCVAIISSLLTIVAVRNYAGPQSADFISRSASSQTTFEKVLSKVGLTETPQQARERRLKEQEAAIEYWNARVESKRGQWNRSTRDAFERNLQAIDESVRDYRMILDGDPDDDLSGEMLDAVMTEKMNLLRDFSDL
jgi:hypothetical protein